MEYGWDDRGLTGEGGKGWDEGVRDGAEGRGGEGAEGRVGKGWGGGGGDGTDHRLIMELDLQSLFGLHFT
jgi:hypothetical protein